MSKHSFILIEGPERCGKSTLAKALVQSLQDILGTEQVVLLREPGSTPLGELLRSHLLKLNPAPYTSALLFNAARYELYTQVIKPALERQQVVVLDRSYPSTHVYQALLGEPLPRLHALTELTLQGLPKPDIVLYPQVTLEEMQRRFSNLEVSDAIEAAVITKLATLLKLYNQEAQEGGWTCLNGNAAPEQVLQDALGHLC